MFICLGCSVNNMESGVSEDSYRHLPLWSLIDFEGEHSSWVYYQQCNTYKKTVSLTLIV